MHRILLVVEQETEFRELVRVACLARVLGRYEVKFCFYNAASDRFERMKTICDQERLPYVLFDQPTGATENTEQNARSDPTGLVRQRGRYAVRNISHWLRVQVKRARSAWLVYCVRGAWYAFRDVKWMVRAHWLFSELNPAIVVVAQDGVGGNRAIIKVARAKHIPVVVVPYEYSTKRQPAEMIVSLQNYRFWYGMHNPVNRLMARWFPHWIYEHNGEQLLRDVGTSIWVEEVLGLAPKLPWTVHGGWADHIAVESEHMRQHYLGEGVSANKLTVSGALSDDVLATAMSEREQNWARLALALDLPRHHRLILCALPPDHVSSRPACDFRSYQEMIDFWVDSLLTLEDATVIFQLHPRVAPEQAEYIAERGAKISRWDIAELIPLCDIFVTSVSSVIRMAIACKKPVINYDVYRFGYADYVEAKGVLTLDDQADFLQVLHKMVTDEAYYAEIVMRQTACADQWGHLDGRAGERMIQLFDQLVSGS